MLAPLLVLALAIAPNVPAVAAVDVEAPVSLTASDGSGLAIARYDVDTVIVGPLAYTELRLAFDNPQDRVIEGRFNIALPDGAAVSRFAMQIDGQWQEAEVVEKQAARRAYEDALHRRQDPALLEQASPNAFSARVFPIAAKGRKELIVSWSEELAGRPWRLPLLGLPQLAAFKARVRHDGRVVVDERHERWVPTKDLAPTLPPIANALLRSDDVVVARVTIPGTSSSSATSSSSPSTAVPTLILLDTSASRGLGEGKDRRFVKDLAARLDPSGKQRFVVVGFDQTSAVLYDGKATAVSLAERRALGASNLGAALDDAARLAKAHGLVRVVIVGDGLVTAGVEGDALVAKAKALGAVGVRRLDAIAVGGLRDVAALRQLVGAGLAEEGIVVDASDDADLAAVSAKRLGLPAKSNVAVAIEGASQVWPRRLDGVQPGDQVVVVAELARGKPVKLTVGGAAVSLTTVVDDSTTGALRETAAPLLRRAWARAKIERLLAARTAENNPAAKAEIAEQIVKVSVEHRVLSPLTA
ncbi:MAG TPA: VIT domain-containing protein, partial [Myxococcota bacterium]